MKTNRSARSILRIRAIVGWLALATIIGSELWLGGSLAGRVGQTTAGWTQEPPAPGVGMTDLLAAAH